MEVRDYLNQSYMLDQKIHCDIENLNDLKEASVSVSGLTYGERLFQSDNSNAGFVKTLYKIDALRSSILKELEVLVDLKAEIYKTVKSCPSTQSRVVLMYRHMMNYDWEKMADSLNVSTRTVHRWYNEAIAEVVMPENPIDLKEILKKS